MLDEKWIILGLIINLAGGADYLWETVKGRTKPNKVSWFIWSLAPLVAFAAEIQQGVGSAAALTFLIGFQPLLVFIASLFQKQAYWKLTKGDLLCGGAAVLGIILWKITGVGNLAIVFSILADLMGAIPTIIKSWKAPQSESSLMYLTDAVSAGITLLTIRYWKFENYGFPLYIMLICGLNYIILRRQAGRTGVFRG